MKRSKKTILILLGVIALVAVIGVLCIGLQAAPTVNYALRICELLQPLVDAKNQTMHIAASAAFGDDSLSLESNVYLVTEADRSYCAIEQNGASVYISDNILFLENGKALKIGNDTQTHPATYKDLLPYIGVLYESLKITAEETEDETIYSVIVTGEQMNTLLAAASLGETLPTEGIEKLNLHLTERNGKLENIVCSGSGTVDETSITLKVTLSGFRILASGDYPIPEEVQKSAATVNPDDLFSLTEDLYRLVLALASFKSTDGTLELMADCGPLQFHTQMQLSDLKTTSNAQLDPQKLQALPEMLGWLCMEGDISCTPKGNTYVYALKLDQQGMQSLSRMILPELSQYGGNLTEGSVSIILEDNAISSMNVSIAGTISVLIVQIPIELAAIFTFA